MKTAVSVPDDVFLDAEAAASRLGWTRSQVYATALRDFLEKQDNDPVTSALNALADQDEFADAPIGPARDLIDSGAWEW